jgi:putative glutamine amidotransferase
MSATRAAVTFGKATKAEPYELALRAAGIEPVRNPESLAGLDGLLLSGGSDINPIRYGQERLSKGDPPDDARDELEIRLLEEALAADLPVLAICRGLQLFNVACGGTLIQHLDSTAVHRQRPRNAEPGKHPAAHRVWVAPKTRLAEIIGGGGHDVNSRHHQAIESVGEGLLVSAIANDGVIEGIEKRGAAFAIAVQWHPEDRIAVSEADRKLFEAFAEALADKSS